MEPINVTNIQSNLTTACQIWRGADPGDVIMVAPNEVIENGIDLQVPVLQSEGEINTSLIRSFTVNGLPNTHAFTVVENTGLISALGCDQNDFLPAVPENPNVKITLNEGMSGQNVKLTLMETIEEGERVIWVLGDIEDSL